MTVIVGLKFQDFTVVAADREENDHYLRNDVRKIAMHNAGAWSLSFAGAGDSFFIDHTAQRIRRKLQAFMTPISAADVRAAIDSELSEVYKRHIFAANIPDPDKRPDFDLLIQASQSGEYRLFQTHLSAATELEHMDHAAIGMGNSYAETLLSKYFGGTSLHGAVTLALYVVMQTKRYVCNVGGGTDICVHSSGHAIGISAALTSKLESLIDQIEFELEGLTFASFCIEGDAWTESLKWFQKKSYGFRNELQNELNRLFVTLGI